VRDVVLIVEPKEVSLGDEGKRTLKIAIRTPDGALRVVKESGKAVYCRSCGGVWGDPFDSLWAGVKTFSIHHYGGSNWRWTNTFTFAYSRRDKTWQLVEVEESGFHTSNPDAMETVTYRPPRHFGKIDIAEFDPEKFKGVGKR
jgi:hypothetical protein